MELIRVVRETSANENSIEPKALAAAAPAEDQKPAETKAKADVDELAANGAEDEEDRNKR